MNKCDREFELVRAERVQLLKDRIRIEELAQDSNSERVIEFCKRRLEELKS